MTDDPVVAGQAGLTECLERLVAEDAPRLFAVAVKPSHRNDVHIAAYGIAFSDHAEVVAKNDSFRGQVRSPERALRYFAVDEDEKAWLLWLPDAARAEGGQPDGPA